MRWIALLFLTLWMPLVADDASESLVPEDPLVVDLKLDGDVVVITLEVEKGKTHTVRDTDRKWDTRLGELYLMHWPTARRDEPAMVVQGKGVPPQVVEKAVDALKAKGLKLVRLLRPKPAE